MDFHGLLSNLTKRIWKVYFNFPFVDIHSVKY